MPPLYLQTDDFLERFNTPSELVLVSSKLSSDSAFSESLSNRVIEEENASYLSKKLTQLKSDLGDDLFNRLSSAQKDFIVSIAGSVSFGFPVTDEMLKNHDS